MKKAFLLVSTFLPALALADAVMDKKIIAELNVDTMQQLIQPQKVADGIYTPYAAWFVQRNDIAPTCALINKDNFRNVLDIMSPSDGEFTNCHQTIAEPLITNIGKDYYATYEYVVEETRGDLKTMYQLVRLTRNGFFACKKDHEISREIRRDVRQKKLKLSAAVEKAVKKFGCAEALPQDDDDEK